MRRVRVQLSLRWQVTVAMPYLTLNYGWILQKSRVSGLSCTVLVTSCFRKALCVTEWATNTRPCAKTSAAMYLRHDNVRQVCLQATALKLSGPTTFNSWPTFSPCLYNGVWSELTCRNSLSHSRLACSRLSAHIQPSVNNPDTNGAAKVLNTTRQYNYNGDELS